MDQFPEPDLETPRRQEQFPNRQPLQLAMLAPTTPLPAPATVEKVGVAKVHKVECWVFDGAEPITTSTGGTFTKCQITDWLKAPSPAIEGGSMPVAGLRMVCWEQQDSMKWPFDRATFEAIQDVLGLPRTYSYFNLSKSGACGKYLGISGQPSKTSRPLTD